MNKFSKLVKKVNKHKRKKKYTEINISNFWAI